MELITKEINSEKISEKNILLVDIDSDISDIKNILNNETNFEIICFDFKSHKLLELYNIPHSLSDDFLSNENCKLIQKYVYKFTYWYLEKNFLSFLEYKGINVGRLYQDDFLNFFVRFLKKFTEVELILKQNPNAKFIAQNELFNIVNFFTSNLKNIKKNPNNSKILTPDQVRINIKIAGSQKNLIIHKNTFQKIKNVLEFFIDIFSKNNNEHSEMNILFVNYNTRRFKDLFIKSREFNSKIFFYGRKRPPFWNLSTLKTIISSKCKIITHGYLNDNQLKRNEILGINEINNNLSKLWEKNNLFEDFFIFSNHKIFKLIKPIFSEFIQNRASETIHEIELADRIFQKIKFDYTIVLNEIGLHEQIISQISRNYNIKCIHMQEGFHWDAKNALENMSSQGVFLQDAKKLAVWGEIDKKFTLENSNVNSDDVKIIGAPRYDNLFQTQKENQKFILLASSGDPQPEEVEGLRIKKIQKYLDDVLKISEIITQLDENLVIKLHPSPTQLMEIISLSQKINKKIIVNTETNDDIESLLPHAKLLICIGFSTVLIEALILKIPVIFIPGVDYNYDDPSIVTEKGCFISNVDDLEQLLKKIFSDKNEINKQQILSQKYLSRLISNPGTGSENFFKYLNNSNN